MRQKLTIEEIRSRFKNSLVQYSQKQRKRDLLTGASPREVGVTILYDIEILDPPLPRCKYKVLESIITDFIRDGTLKIVIRRSRVFIKYFPTKTGVE